MRMSDWSSDVCSSDLTASSQIAGAESDQLRERTARTEIVPLAALADEAVSSEAVHLRSLLTPNLACPVCGDRKSVVKGKSGSVRVDLGGRRIIKTKIKEGESAV